MNKHSQRLKAKENHNRRLHRHVFPPFRGTDAACAKAYTGAKLAPQLPWMGQQAAGLVWLVVWKFFFNGF